MSMDYVRRTYGVPAKRGARVQTKMQGRLYIGTITRATHYVYVRFDGIKRPIPFHPLSLRYSEGGMESRFALEVIVLCDAAKAMREAINELFRATNPEQVEQLTDSPPSLWDARWAHAAAFQRLTNVELRIRELIAAGKT